jgi:hypothetical protein
LTKGQGTTHAQLCILYGGLTPLGALPQSAHAELPQSAHAELPQSAHAEVWLPGGVRGLGPVPDSISYDPALSLSLSLAVTLTGLQEEEEREEGCTSRLGY